MTNEEAKQILSDIDHAWRNFSQEEYVALDVAIKALETLEEFEKAQIITGVRLNGKTYAFKCGLEDGKRKALEQEPCEDCISREQALKCFTWTNAKDDVYYGIKALPSIQSKPKTEWIPVSERLPEAGKQYLCCNEDGFREVGYLSKVTGEWGFTDTEAFGEVIAWMPLPEPYKTESEDKE